MEQFANPSQQTSEKTAHSGSYSFMLGDFACLSVSDGSMNYPLEDLFANVPKSQAEQALRQRNQLTQHVMTPYACLFVNTGLHKVLIDTGAGPMLGAMAPQVFPSVDNSATVTGALPHHLEAAGIHPADIDTVIITHAHPDHIGGMLDGNGQPIYFNAHYFIARDEWAFWNSDAALQLPPIFAQMARGALAPVQDRLTLVEDGDEVVPGIRVIATPGHTAGHISLSITSKNEELLVFADAILHPAMLEHGDWHAGFDMLPEVMIASRQHMLERAADSHALVHVFHFAPFPSLGHVVRSEEGWQWQSI